ncbi:MAG: type IA DNA topoisomerase [Lachnospiraceae bacterium]|nr:type IA DNA topoisomerase [Lachnospiraceae bacterium]
MGKALFIAEKPSVARQFAEAMDLKMSDRGGFLECDRAIVTWCVGHLITMSYPEVYDAALKRWSLDTLPFIPTEWKYEVIKSAAKQYKIVAELLNRDDVDTIYVCTDSGREGEYIYRLVDQEAHVTGKTKKRVWIDSQTKDEILRGIREAKDLSEYDNLSAAAYLRAKEDYLMGINFSRLLSLKYGYDVHEFLGGDKYVAISVGRVMTCVLGMVVRREREIRDFKKTSFYRVISDMTISGTVINGDWKVTEQSAWYNSPALYKDNGFKERKDAEALIASLSEVMPAEATVQNVSRKKDKKNPPLLYNLAELQNACSKMFKISPDQTLEVVQELYEKKLVTYPRTDARVLSTAIAKEIHKNIGGLSGMATFKPFCDKIMGENLHKGIEKSRYTDDKQITDHYAIIPTGQGLGALNGLSPLKLNIYETIVRRFLAIFYPPAEYTKVSLVTEVKNESFFTNFKMLKEKGYLEVMDYSFMKKKDKSEAEQGEKQKNGDETEEIEISDDSLLEAVASLKKGSKISVSAFNIKEGETSPPSRYSSGSIILAMENAGKLIEDEELRAQIKGSGIGTSATRAEIIAKLERIGYIYINKKTQIITPGQRGEMVYDVVFASIKALLNPELTASWEKGLTQVAEGTISADEYMQKLSGFIVGMTEAVKGIDNRAALKNCYRNTASFYKKTKSKK